MREVHQSGVDVRVISLISMVALFVFLSSTTASFLADHPGADLSPRGRAEEVIELLQGSEAILWSSLAGSVSSYNVTGWPFESNGNELGGALVIERPEDGLAGVIDFGEKPMSVTFELEG